MVKSLGDDLKFVASHLDIVGIGLFAVVIYLAAGRPLRGITRYVPKGA